MNSSYLRSAVIRNCHTRTHHLFSASSYFPFSRRCKTFMPVFHRPTSFCSKPERASSAMDEVEKEKGHSNSTSNEDVMYHSFGEGYATRSEDEGFGVIYAGKHSVEGREKGPLEDQIAEDIKEARTKNGEANTTH